MATAALQQQQKGNVSLRSNKESKKEPIPIVAHVLTDEDADLVKVYKVVFIFFTFFVSTKNVTELYIVYLNMFLHQTVAKVFCNNKETKCWFLV